MASSGEVGWGKGGSSCDEDDGVGCCGCDDDDDDRHSDDDNILDDGRLTFGFIKEKASTSIREGRHKLWHTQHSISIEAMREIEMDDAAAGTIVVII